MIKIFRNTPCLSAGFCLGLIGKSKFSGYLDFALGEIDPVVIGFLTAHRFSRPRPIPASYGRKWRA